ncbi:MAG: DUF3089 domain-containing protein [Coriobacteriales bacterium]|jgi:hypothetical protein|nr:DUF3089 domain-containing protein [Coriobacteriales bacterium]
MEAPAGIHPVLPDEASPVDYRDPDNWLALPSALYASASRPFDVFYLYPTACFREDLPQCAANDPAMRSRARKKYEQQASIFAAGAIYAPYYRQLSMARFPQLRSIAAIRDEIARFGGVDARAAFLHYREYADANRPIVFAGHSQGTIVLLALLPWLRTHLPEVLDQTIACYLIGFTITPFDVERIGLPFATRADDTGVIISYNTEKVGTTSFNPLITAPDALVINPVNWCVDETPAPRELSLGSRLPDENGALHDLPQFASARIDLTRRAVLTDAPIEARTPWPTGVLHSQDLALFYHDLAANVELRAAVWRETHVG